MYRAVDVMGFAGGFTLGTVRAGFELVGKRELTGGFGVPNCEGNRELLGHGWRSEVGEPDDWTPVRDAHLVFGNPPCSGFSVMTSSAHRGIDAKVNHCMWAFANYAAACAPPIAIFESVRPAYSTGRPLMQKLRLLLEERTGRPYHLYHVYHNAYELGGVAIRPRYFWVASQVPFGVEWPRLENEDPVVGDAWRDLEGLGDTWQPQPYRRPPTTWSKAVRTDAGVVDGHVTQDALGIRRALDLLRYANEHVGGWPRGRDMSWVTRRCYETTGTLPDSWLHRIPKLLDRNFDTGFITIYRWDDRKPGRVIVGGALSLAIHPTEDRMITHREAARVMGFPDDWQVRPMRHYTGLASTWGKGITVTCGEWIAGWARAALDGHPGTVVGDEVGDRENLIVPPRRSRPRRPADVRSHQEVTTK